jgi:RNA-directed DNA polymerase
MAVALSRSCDPMRQARRLDTRAQRVQDPVVRPLLKQISTVGGPVGGPQGGPFRPLAAHLSWHEVDGTVDASRRKTAEGPDEAGNSHRFAEDSVLTVRGPHQKGGAKRAVQRLEDQL